MIVDSTRVVIGGVDTHLDEHVAADVDGVGSAYPGYPNSQRTGAFRRDGQTISGPYSTR